MLASVDPLKVDTLKSFMLENQRVHPEIMRDFLKKAASESLEKMP